MLKISSIILMLLLSNNLYAGINGLTHHSRANCVNNETVSWDLTEYHELYVVSAHIKDNKFEHWSIVEPSKTWRAAAVHWGEGKGGWVVEGTHYEKNLDGQYILAQFERVMDCSIYDGWWDHDKKGNQYD
jgi:hypothetical protein